MLMELPANSELLRKKSHQLGWWLFYGTPFQTKYERTPWRYKGFCSDLGLVRSPD